MDKAKLSTELQNQINQLNQLRKQALKQEQDEQKLFEKTKLRICHILASSLILSGSC